MRKTALAIAALVAMAACTPLGLYYKQGATVQSAEDAQTRCEVAALNDVPVKRVTRVIHPRHIPPRKICDADGDCIIKPAIFLPPEYITEDANERLRAKAVDLCMRQKGYQFVKLPACQSAPKNIRQTVRMPKLSAQACVARGQSGAWQIITP